MVRQAAASTIEAAGCDCQVAESYDEALDLFRENAGISVVILDHGVKGDDTASFVRRLKAIRPSIILVGSSGGDVRDDFASVGVPRFLQKPWTADDLIRAIYRIGECVDCKLPIPLRRPLPGERGSSWVCRGCGSRYHALLDHDAPPEHRENIESVDAGR
jgi:CheY-like chemotaxis protein